MEPISCTRASIERARTKPFTVPFDFASWDMQPQLLQRAFVERPGAFARWARKQARATTRAEISERETRLKKRAMNVLMEMAELQLEAGNQVVVAAAAAAGAIQQAGPSGEQDDAEAQEAAKLSTEQKEALMQAIDSQTPEQVEEASQFLARAARAMAASPGEAVNVFDYLDDEDAPEVDVFDYLEEDSPLADEQMRELAGKLASAESSCSDGTSPITFDELALALATPLSGAAPGPSSSSSQVPSRSSRHSVPGAAPGPSGSSSRAPSSSSRHSTPGPAKSRSHSSRHRSGKGKERANSESSSKASSSRIVGASSGKGKEKASSKSSHKSSSGRDRHATK